MTHEHDTHETVVVDSGGGSSNGLILGIIAVVILLVAVWYFALGPGTGGTTNNTTNNNTVNPPAASQAAPAASTQGTLFVQFVSGAALSGPPGTRTLTGSTDRAGGPDHRLQKQEVWCGYSTPRPGRG